MDRYDLYGKMAIPKNHESGSDIPELYRLAASQRGVFVSSAYVENFGLTFIEAAATGLPFIGTDTGGPVDIQNNTHAGILVDLNDPDNLTEAMRRALTEEGLWETLSSNGINNTREHYTWGAHCETYLDHLKEVVGRPAKTVYVATRDQVPIGQRFTDIQHLLITDIDDTLLGDEEAFLRFREALEQHHGYLGFGVATGRWLESASAVLTENGLHDVGIYITSVGTEIHYGPKHVSDQGWQAHISHRWYPDRIREALAELPFLELQDEPKAQSDFKISYNLDDSVDPEEALPRAHEALTRAKASYNLIFSHGAFVDVLPYRASKGKAIRYLSNKWEIPLSRIVTAGNSGNDADMMLGNVKAIVVSNHEAELDNLRGANRIHFSETSHADGILEGLRHYKILKDQ
jgi:sucrose-phosphate synthase